LVVHIAVNDDRATDHDVRDAASIGQLV